MSRLGAQPLEVGKTDRPGHTSPPIEVVRYQKDVTLCPVFYLNACLRRLQKVTFINEV